MNDIKAKLHALCVSYVTNRMQAAQQAIAEAQQAQSDDTKSSAGDKYETGREMAQQETNRNLAQLDEANKLMVALNTIALNSTSQKAETGSVICTNNGNFYLAISAGTLTVDGSDYIAVSPASPIGHRLKDKKPGDEFILNEKTYQIQHIF
ncbi:3-oxoacyl-ACP synthase [Mucilaginibacter sp. AK015]|uniref:3-oxoacyl-ACP synthase n=1 Tax=Mucilaginibacter sp. AK015 TaxID=2723072 RepID=UPI00160CAA75|nr:3-oxoacyl-ACP synthase [Mucilaginibacter sp. AK015]MBB5396430.1 transcription elongation GreA/GreB family factor [Mucilaginibacter sp. AK015]